MNSSGSPRNLAGSGCNADFTLDESGDVLPMRDGFDGAYAVRLVRKA